MVTSARRVGLFVFDDFADWEPAFALTGLRRWGKRGVTVIGETPEPVTSMGGLRVTPDQGLTEVDPAGLELLLIPGGDRWETTDPPERLAALLATLEQRQIPIAAICGATVALARLGFFRERRHTSNGPDYLARHAAGYRTPSLYVDTLAVRDRRVISASGLGAIELAREIFAELEILKPSDLALYQRLYRGGERPAAPA